MGIGTALLIWVATAIVVTALLALSTRGRAEIWTLGFGLALLAVLLGFVVATPSAAPVTVGESQPIILDTMVVSPTTTAASEPLLPTETTRALLPTQAPSSSPTAYPTLTQAESTVQPPLSEPLVYVTAVPPVQTSTSTPPVAPVLPDSTTSLAVRTVIAAGANVRSAPELGDNIVGQVFQGDELLVIRSENDWLLVRLGTNVSAETRIADGGGWIDSSLVDSQ